MPCPICDKPTETDFRPFCSKRCADIDLAKWFSGAYAIPADNPEDAEELEQQLDAAERQKPH
ncbi:DNA gyrase inhibitor YacG [Yoonia algicola]|uniref:DNA gyrase inhibitor YacG n=1 Tax=Yoonia algicola TaxID=3137368 RepID=A0AAN0M9J7_9RHOB